MKIYADLHNHTTASDGEFSPSELVALAAEKGLHALAVTDHDTIDGLREGLEAAAECGIEFCPGLEVTVRFAEPDFKGSLHVLLYFGSALLDDRKFCAELNGLLADGRGAKLTEARIEAVNYYYGPDSDNPKLMRPLTPDDLYSFGSNITRRHFALALSELHGIKEKSEINELISNSSEAYIPAGICLSDLKCFLRKYDILAVLAHPAAGSFPGDSHYREVLPPVEIVESFLPRFLDAGINGLEVFYPGHTEEHTQLLLGWAEKHTLVVTGGSDCHDHITRPVAVCGLTESYYDMARPALFNRVY